MAKTKNDSSEGRSFGTKLGGLPLLFVVGCLAYIVLFPISMIVGVASELMPIPHPAVIILLTIMELTIIAIVVLLLRRDRRYIYAYIAGLVVALAMCLAQGILGITTPLIAIASAAVSLVGAALILLYFTRSQRIKDYLYFGNQKVRN